MNANKSVGNLNTLAYGSIGFLGKVISSGFLSPFWLIPDNIKNLSPIIFKSKSTQISNINPICYDSYLNQKINSEFENTF